VCEDCYAANLSNCRRRHVLCDTELCLAVIRFLYFAQSRVKSVFVGFAVSHDV
jgi:hypothetical protein